MLITLVRREDIQKWVELSHEADEIVKELVPDTSVFWETFDDYMESKIRKHEAFMAKDRMSGNCLGIVAFSRKYNRITFFGVSMSADFEKVGEKLLEVALKQLDRTKEITANVLKLENLYFQQERKIYEKFGFIKQDGEVLEEGVPAFVMKRAATGEKKRASFHHNYSRYIDWSNESKCPVCCDEPGPSDIELIKELKYSWVEASINAQGCLWGKCHVLSKKHYVEIHDIPQEDLTNFMSDVQKVSKALKEISGAVKINCELHGNSMPHLHMHLFPRYIDDAFAGSGIDVNKIEPNPYENKDEFDYFINEMRKVLSE
ncbi:GNAT family N-acetyltransferase [Oceanirhabdus sp. W0125-5]|uniref:GNAT family N-acetyltransferase n=1 Tax=Oceanirhabdus sp. W0125-5 TaxID=2999116 RepID=UPI0022F2F59D|nr:GNAT family N-acetyltransferase [Oceanirhabdus sp. W0125-5]WBW96315.1 GNAT family N-acetyltransferase [Oceanirhabdus sp. W0125-5]